MADAEVWHSSAQQRLRRLRMLDDAAGVPAVQVMLGGESNIDPLSRPAGRTLVRNWARSQMGGPPLALAGQILSLEHMRGNPVEGSAILSNEGLRDFAAALTACAFHVARDLHEVGKTAFAEGDIDKSVNHLQEAQREFLFATTSGNLHPDRVREAKGRYAVAVAFTSRWLRTSVHVLRRALQYQRESIEAGNRAPEAWVYLVELLVEVFNRTGDLAPLHEAQGLSQRHELKLACAEIGLKCELLELSGASSQRYERLKSLVALAGSHRCTTGVDFVRVELLRQFTLAAAMKTLPLSPREIRFPFGFLVDVPRLDPAQVQSLIDIVIPPLQSMQDGLVTAGRKPNVVAIQVMATLLASAVSRDELRTPRLTGLLVEVASAAAKLLPGNRHYQWREAEALLAHASATGEEEHLAGVLSTCQSLAQEDATWPLPWVTLARARGLGEHLGAGGNEEDPVAAWGRATDLVVNATEYRRTDLGGRSGVFAAEDPRGDLATTLVFKRVDSVSLAERERQNMQLLHDAIAAEGAGHRFGVPTSLAVVQASDAGPVHVMERQVGRLLAAMPVEEAQEYLQPCAQLLGLYHRVAPRPAPGVSGWKAVKNNLAICARTLFGRERANEFVAEMKAALPSDLPVVAKRDAHASNWVIDAADRVIAIDLQGSSPVPVGYDIAQLVEDAALISPTGAGFEIRYALAATYTRAAMLEIDPDLLQRAYDWFALHRAVMLASSSRATKAAHRHARQLANYIARESPLGLLRDPALALTKAATHLGRSTEPESLTRGQRTMSKAMAKLLRHDAPRKGLMPDEGGFVQVREVAEVLGVPVDRIEEVASHPAESRFEMDGEQIRALYGHSFEVPDMNDIDVEMPATLYHGTSWTTLNAIASEGLRPMRRRYVHLTNNPTEAMQVARRHGQAVLLSVDTALMDEARAVADAVWAVDQVDPQAIRVSNVFAEVAVPPEWLTA